MANPNDILGMNARERLYRTLNKSQGKKYANSKLELKRLMESNTIPTPKLYARFASMDEVYDFNFSEISTSFVVKPIGGNGGKGILVIRRKGEAKPYWVDYEGKSIKSDDVVLHIHDILDGLYSTYGTSHEAFVEERIHIHPRFRRMVFKGTPDVRVIVFNKVPVMAMLRLPTRESEGRANLHQGAIGVGIDIATGITLRGIKNNQIVKRVPDSTKKLNGVKIPSWTKTLETAVRVSELTGLAFCGVDLFIDETRGPMVVEVNANPVLSIQIANGAGLRRRLDRVEGLTIRDLDHGVRVGKALFGERFADKVVAEDGLEIIENFPMIKIRSKDGEWFEYKAKVDTGAHRTSIDRGIAKSLGLLKKRQILWYGDFTSALGVQKRPVIEAIMKIKSKKISTAVSVADRSKSLVKILIGRKDLDGFLVKPMPIKEKYAA